jgi:hypothetical protein
MQELFLNDDGVCFDLKKDQVQDVFRGDSDDDAVVIVVSCFNKIYYTKLWQSNLEQLQICRDLPHNQVGLHMVRGQKQQPSVF